MARAAVWLGFAATSGLLTACGLLVDMHGLSGGSGDAGAPVVVNIDSGDPLDASDAGELDASDAAELDGAHRFCSTVDAGVFCEDFDQPDEAFAEWGFNVVNGGSVVLGSTDSKSAPNFLRTAVAPGTGADGSKVATGELLRFVGNRSTITYLADVRLAKGPSSKTLEFHSLRATDRFWMFFLSVSSAGNLDAVEEWTCPDGGFCDKYTAVTGTLPLDKWIPIAVSADFTTNSFSITLDGAPAAAGRFYGAVAVPPLRVGAGITWVSSPNIGGIIDIDNIVVGF